MINECWKQTIQKSNLYFFKSSPCEANEENLLQKNSCYFWYCAASWAPAPRPLKIIEDPQNSLPLLQISQQSAASQLREDYSLLAFLSLQAHLVCTWGSQCGLCRSRMGQVNVVMFADPAFTLEDFTRGRSERNGSSIHIQNMNFGNI